MKEELPSHLGGHFGVCHIDSGVLEYAINKLSITSMLDIGCGLGGMVELGMSYGLDSYGIDGDYSVSRNPILSNNILIHDYTIGCSGLMNKVGMVWSCEFLEHVEEKYIDNYMKDFQLGKYIFITHALPGKLGHHHVNCKDSLYWENIFNSYGFQLDLSLTLGARGSSTMGREFFRENGLVFLKEEER
jgi:hypothetical protein